MATDKYFKRSSLPYSTLSISNIQSTHTHYSTIKVIQKLRFNLFRTWMKSLVLAALAFWCSLYFGIFDVACPSKVFSNLSVWTLFFSQCLQFYGSMTPATFHNHISIFFQNDIRWLIEIQNRYSGKFCWSAARLWNRIWIH